MCAETTTMLLPLGHHLPSLACLFKMRPLRAWNLPIRLDWVAWGLPLSSPAPWVWGIKLMSHSNLALPSSPHPHFINFVFAHSFMLVDGCVCLWQASAPWKRHAGVEQVRLTVCRLELQCFNRCAQVHAWTLSCVSANPALSAFPSFLLSSSSL